MSIFNMKSSYCYHTFTPETVGGERSDLHKTVLLGYIDPIENGYHAEAHADVARWWEEYPTLEAAQKALLLEYHKSKHSVCTVYHPQASTIYLTNDSPIALDTTIEYPYYRCDEDGTANDDGDCLHIFVPTLCKWVTAFSHDFTFPFTPHKNQENKENQETPETETELVTFYDHWFLWGRTMNLGSTEQRLMELYRESTETYRAPLRSAFPEYFVHKKHPKGNR